MIKITDDDQMPYNNQKREKWPSYKIEEEFIAYPNFREDVE